MSMGKFRRAYKKLYTKYGVNLQKDNREEVSQNYRK